MTPEQIQQLKSVLLQLRRELTQQMDDIRDLNKDGTMKEQSGDHSGYAFHMADQGTDMMQRETNFLHVERDGKLLAEVEDALEKIEKGNYGTCEFCDSHIKFARLEFMPYTKLCIQCQSNEESPRRQTEMLTSEEF